MRHAGAGAACHRPDERGTDDATGRAGRAGNRRRPFWRCRAALRADRACLSRQRHGLVPARHRVPAHQAGAPGPGRVRTSLAGRAGHGQGPCQPGAGPRDLVARRGRHRRAQRRCRRAEPASAASADARCRSCARPAGAERAAGRAGAVAVTRRDAAGRVRAQCGAATIEFYIIAFWVLVPLFMAILQLGLFMVAKNTANVATLAAARAGAASGLDMGEMRRAFASHIAPLYATSGLRRISDAGFADAQSNYKSVGLSAIARARLETEGVKIHRITVLNPTSKSFDDFQITRASDKAQIIPVDGLYANNAMGGKSQQQRSDALLLKIETRYCYQMIIPVIDSMIIKVLTSDLWSDHSVDHLTCYAINAIPILSQSVVRITVPPERGKLEK
ncbi:hypothetical protein F2P46_22120 [Massilia sp. CCM 8734]|nr:hypothetical protein [Massilia sp. CCM 8734]